MFESSQWADADRDFPVLAAAIRALPRPSPGGDAMVDGGRLRGLLVLQRRLQAQVLAEVSSFDEQGFATAYGMASTQAWVRAYASLDNGQAAAMVNAARLLRTLPAVGETLAAGQVGVEHVVALGRATRQVPEEVLASHDLLLRDLVVHARPSDMARAGDKITEVHLHDTVTGGDPAAVLAVRRVTLAQTLDGIWALDGTLTAEDGAKLAAALEPLMRKRGPEDERTPVQRRADALSELVDIALRSGKLPQAGGDRTRITLMVHLTEQALDTTSSDDDERDDTGEDAAATGRIGTGRRRSSLSLRDLPGPAAGRGRWPGGLRNALRVAAIFGDGGSARQLLGSHARISDEALARIACDADINVAVLSRGGDILHQGKASRDPSVAQHRGLVVRDGGCVFPGCDRLPAACQAHHLIFWVPAGLTDIENLALVCGFHHMLVHDHHWQLDRLPVTPDSPYGGWQATAPHGLVLRQLRQQVA